MLTPAIDLGRLGNTDTRIAPLGTGAWSWGDSMVYGWGKSERFLGKFIRESRQKAIVATKFFPYPGRLRKNALLKALRGSLDRLEIDQVDLYQIHWPFPPIAVKTWMDGSR
jgi:aryl-alcohol dehydrogenase-like predicted oxidoreductase